MPVSRSSMTYGSETKPLLADAGLKFERAEMQMIKWMSGVSMKDRMTNEELRTLVEVDPIFVVLPYLEVTGHPVQVSSPGFKWIDSFGTVPILSILQSGKGHSGTTA